MSASSLKADVHRPLLFFREVPLTTAGSLKIIEAIHCVKIQFSTVSINLPRDKAP
jgi:hypothetical protein